MTNPHPMPPQYDLPFGQPVSFDGRLMAYRGRARDRDRRHRFEGVDGLWRDLADQELRDLQQQERLLILSAVEAATQDEALKGGGRQLVTVDAFGQDKKRERAELEYRLEHCLAWRRAGRPPRTARNIRGISDSIAPPPYGRKPAKKPCPRTVLTWISSWIASGEADDGLVPQFQNRGNRQDRLTPVARELLESTVEKHYLVDTRPTAVRVHHLVRDTFKKHNEVVPPSEQLEHPSLDAVYNYIHTVDAYTLDFSRYGKRVAHHKWAPVSTAPASVHHNETWEVDHTRVDLIVVDEETGLPIGRPWLTLVIDRATRMICGFYIGFEGPGVDAVFAALTASILPKDRLLEELGIAVPWPCEGVPTTLVTDQGKEFKSLAFLEACRQLSIDVQYTPILKAWYKGRIERAIKTMTATVFHTVEGTTFANHFERNKEQVPEKIAKATLPELRERFAKTVVEAYHRTRHRALFGQSPLEAWAASVKTSGASRLPPDPRKVRDALARVYWRVPQREGLQVNSLLYEASELADIRVHPECQRLPVKVKLDRADLSRVHFVDPRDRTTKVAMLKAHLRDRVRGVTLDRWKLALAMQRENPEQFGGDEGVFRAYAMMDRKARLQSVADGSHSREAAAKHWAKVKHTIPYEEAPAFDTGRGSRPVSELFDEEEDQTLEAMVDRKHTGSMHAQEEVHDPVPLGDIATESTGSEPRPKKEKLSRNRRDVSEAATPMPPEDDFDPDAYAREHGRGLDKRRIKGGKTDE
jgi:transposase InsO family protein